MATGVLPFHGETVALMFERLLNHYPVPPSELVPSLLPEFDRILAQALEKDRRYRYQSAPELRTALLRLRREVEAKPATEGRLSDRAPIVGSGLFGCGALL